VYFDSERETMGVSSSVPTPLVQNRCRRAVLEVIRRNHPTDWLPQPFRTTAANPSRCASDRGSPHRYRSSICVVECQSNAERAATGHVPALSTTQSGC
jgi:hypothetical protein